ncbi:MAG: hypothetical protein ABIH04_09405 [Planctomycetota bacterium]
MQSTETPYVPPQRGMPTAAVMHPNYRLRAFIVFFIWFVLVGLVPFMDSTTNTGALFNFNGEVKKFFDAKPNFIEAAHWVLSMAFPLLFAIVLLFFCPSFSERALGAMLFLMGAVHWLLYALGPVVTIISKKSLGLFYAPLANVAEADRWREAIPYWALMVLMYWFVLGVFAIFVRRRGTHRGVLIALKAAIVLALIYFVPFWPDGADKYTSLWHRLMSGNNSFLRLILSLAPLVTALLALLSLTGIRRKRFLTGLAGALLFAYLFLPLWTGVMAVGAEDWTNVKAIDIPRTVCNKFVDIFVVVRGDWCWPVPGFILPSIFLAGMGIFLFTAGQGRKPVAFYGTSAAPPRHM